METRLASALKHTYRQIVIKEPKSVSIPEYRFKERGVTLASLLTLLGIRTSRRPYAERDHPIATSKVLLVWRLQVRQILVQLLVVSNSPLIVLSFSSYYAPQEDID